MFAHIAVLAYNRKSLEYFVCLLETTVVNTFSNRAIVLSFRIFKLHTDPDVLLVAHFESCLANKAYFTCDKPFVQGKLCVLVDPLLETLNKIHVDQSTVQKNR